MWTIDRKVEALLRLPWTVRSERDATDGAITVVCNEIPAAIGVGRTEGEVSADFYESLRAALMTYLEEGETPPLPKGRALPWNEKGTPLFVMLIPDGEAAEQVRATESSAPTSSPELQPA